MRNFVSAGKALDLTAPAAVTSGAPVKIGGLVVVPAADAASGAAFVGYTEGVFDVTSDTGAAWSEGDTIYWDATNSRFTKTSTSNTKCGVAAAAKLSAATSGRILLFPCI